VNHVLFKIYTHAAADTCPTLELREHFPSLKNAHITAIIATKFKITLQTFPYFTVHYFSMKFNAHPKYNPVTSYAKWSP
jgi:hypothetical protein